MTDCRVCTAETADVWLCGRCLREIERALAELPHDLADLEAVATRQAAGPLGLGDPSRQWDGPTCDGALGDSGWMFAPGAADLIWAIGNTLGTWTRHLTEARGVQPPTLDTLGAVAWLLTNLNAIAQDETAAQIYDELTSIPQAVHRNVIGRGTPIFAGRCDSKQITAVHQSVAIEHNRAYRVDRLAPKLTICGADLYGHLGETTVTCRACGTGYPLAERKRWMREQVDEQWARPQLIADALTTLDEPVKAATLRKWIERGHVRQVGIDDDGNALYRVGDVRERISAMSQARRVACA